MISRLIFHGWRLWLALALAVTAAPASAEATMRPAFENAHVRVLELFASPGATRAMHVQPPGVLVSLGKARFEMTGADGRSSIVDYNPGQVLWTGVAERRAWRLLAGEAHLFFVEVKSAAAGTAPPPAPIEPRHSTIVDPDQHHLLLDNDHVRIIDGFGPVGAWSAPHTHPPSVLVSLAKSRFKVTIADKTRIFDFEPAAARWTNHFEHSWKVLAGEARVIMVEIKSAHGDPAFRRRTVAPAPAR